MWNKSKSKIQQVLWSWWARFNLYPLVLNDELTLGITHLLDVRYIQRKEDNKLTLQNVKFSSNPKYNLLLSSQNKTRNLSLVICLLCDA